MQMSGNYMSFFLFVKLESIPLGSRYDFRTKFYINVEADISESDLLFMLEFSMRHDSKSPERWSEFHTKFW